MRFKFYRPKFTTTTDNLSPLFLAPIPAGEPQDAEPVAEWINLHDFVESSVDGTIFLRVYGDGKEEIGIFDGDLLVVKRQEFADLGDLVIAEEEGEFSVIFYDRPAPQLQLVETRRRAKRSRNSFTIFGIVTFVIHRTSQMKPRSKSKKGM